MRGLLLIIAAVAVVGGLLAWQMIDNTSYILVVYGNYTIDMSLWTFLLIIFLLWLLWRIIRASMRVIVEPGQKFLKHRGVEKQRRYRAHTTRGLLQYIEGQWSQARRSLKRSAKHSDMPLVNYLVAANSAYEMGDQEDANRLLEKAQQVDSESSLAVGLAQAKMYLRDEHFEEALAILQRLHVKAPNQPLILRLLNNAYRGLKDWRSLEKLLADFKRFKVFNPHVLQRVESEVYSSLLVSLTSQAKKTGDKKDTDELIQLWHDMPKSVQMNHRVRLSYITSLHLLGESNRAEALLRKSLKDDWQAELVRLYGIVTSDDPQKQLIYAEGWLRQRTNDPELMLALGRLSQRNQLWGKARDYLESSLALKVQPEAYAELARLMVQLGDHEKSASYYQKGLALSAEYAV